ncbi:DUF4350 domain-containing protein [Streptosporangiaceae bacterium NEAU-GS5]|nr:DUF4350 domain-containing protein [Streptosporangiaceae bacterium NEAU-GS5]
MLGVFILLAIATAALSSPTPGGYLDPDATTPEGAHALTQLLRDQGVEVNVATTLDEARRTARAGALLVVARTEFLIDDTILAGIAELPGDRLIVEPYREALDTLAPHVREQGTRRTQIVFPQCDLREATRAGGARMGGTLFNVTAGAYRCYRLDGAASLLRYADSGRTITVVGSGEFMTNQRLAEQGNAALALNLAGVRPSVTWLAPRVPQGLATGDTSLFDMIPAGVKWAAFQLGLVVLVVALWRGRRLGPLVTERLPVVVRASETAQGRGRLYRARRARDRAAGALRAAWLDRVVPLLGLTGISTGEEIVAATAARTGQDALQIRTTLYGDAPGDDAALVALARDLDTLERQVGDT